MLTSIRRLVSEEKRPLRETEASDDDAPGVSSGKSRRDRLVLTPDQRVDTAGEGAGGDHRPEGGQDAAVSDDRNAGSGKSFRMPMDRSSSMSWDPAQDEEAGFMAVEDEDVVSEPAPVLRLDDTARLPELGAEPHETVAMNDTGSVLEPAAMASDTLGGSGTVQAAPLVLGPRHRDPQAAANDASTGESVAVADPAIGSRVHPEDLDEDTLRDIVGEIVRQELRGELGERVTRNVRKLVRREILRVLESKELD